MEGQPEKRSGGAGRVLDRLLENYFRVPGREGFSAYRTGWVVHFAFSMVVATGISAGVVALGFKLLPALIVATIGVVALWGAGTLVGIHSHYDPRILFATMAVVAGLIFYEPAIKYLVLSILPAVFAHVVIVPALVFGLKQVRRLFP